MRNGTKIYQLLEVLQISVNSEHGGYNKHGEELFTLDCQANYDDDEEETEYCQESGQQ